MSVGTEFRKCESAWVSLSCYATVQLTAFRNKEDAKGKPQPMEGLETFARRFTAEIGYALLFVVSVIETLVRTALSVIVLPPMMALGCCMDLKASCPKENCMGLIEVTYGGVVASAENVANTAVALFSNPCQEEIDYDELIPWFKGYNGDMTLSGFKCD